MKRRTFLKNSVAGVGGLAGIRYRGLTLGQSNNMPQPRAEHDGRLGDTIGRPSESPASVFQTVCRWTKSPRMWTRPARPK